MVFAKATMDDYVRRLGIHRAAPLPAIAYSLTLEQARAVDRGRIGWMVSVLAFFALLYGAILAANEADREAWRIFAIAFAVLAVIVGGLVWHRLHKRRDYRDPRVRIEVGEQEVSVVGPAGRDSRPYEALAIPELISVATKSSRSFCGLVLDSRLGPIRLEDEHFRDGAAVAGAILKRLDELGVALNLSR